MDFDNALSDSMVKRVISFVVAVIIVSVVAIPVVNAITDENGSDGGDSETITYTNTGDFYYKSATADNSLHTFEYIHKEHLINEDDWEWIDSYEIDGVEVLRYSPDISEMNIPQLFIGWSETTQYWIEPGNALNYKELNGSRGLLDVEFTDLVDTETDYNFTFRLSIQNGTMSYVDMNTNQTQTVPIKYYLSSEEQGDYVLSETPIVAENTDIYIAKEGDAPETNHQSATEYYTLGGKINSSELTQDTVIVQGVGYYGTGTFYQEGTLYCEMNSIKGDNILTLSSMEVHGYFTVRFGNTNHSFEFTEFITQFLVPKTVTVTIDPSAPVEVTVTNSGQTYALTDDNTPSMTISVKEDNGHWQVYLGTWGNQYDQMVYECANNPDAIPMVLLCGGTDIEGSHTSNGYWMLSNGTILCNGTILPSNSVIEISGKYAEIHNSGNTYCDYYISSDGNYVYSTESKTLNDSTIYVYASWFDESADKYVSFGSKGTISNISENITVSTPNYSGFNATNVSIDKTDKGGYTILNSITVTATDPSDSSITYSGTADGFIVPKTFTYTESSDSGSDSSSNMTNTIIKTIPIFLVLGLLVAFALPMVQGKFE